MYPMPTRVSLQTHTVSFLMYLESQQPNTDSHSLSSRAQLGTLQFAETSNETMAGKVAVKVSKTVKGMEMELTVPKGSSALVHIPSDYGNVLVNGNKVVSNEREGKNTLYRVSEGNHQIKAE